MPFDSVHPGGLIMKYGIALAMLALLAGCDLFTPDVEETKPTDARQLVNSLVYVKAPNGLCFGVTTTGVLNTSGAVAYNQHIVNVPCQPVGL